VIKTENVTKTFDGFEALKNMSCVIPKGSIYGLVGSNGAGKSTFLRLVTGVYATDTGNISIDGERVWDNPRVKSKFVFVPDELFFLRQASMNRMAKLYKTFYRDFCDERFGELTNTFKLNPKKNIATFSKGMKRQAAIVLSLACRPEYLFFDETFDGLDAIKRNLLRQVIAGEVNRRNLTVVITSHSLRELEDTCDQLTLLHQGGVVFERDVQDLKTSLFKVQIAFDYEYDKELLEDIELLDFVKKGQVSNFITKGDRDGVVEKLKSKNPILIEVLPLSLEEVFIHELGALGYMFEENKET
jgi:ABC-2 type transport system ATP-binding protein